MSAKFKNLKTDSLPSHWSADFFGNLVDYKLGKTPPRASAAYWKEGKYPWVSISDMTPHGVVTETAEKVSQAAYDTVFRGKLVPEGSLLMSFKLTIGRMSRLGIPAFHNEAIISFQPDPEKLSDVYLSYYLSQINYKDYQDTAIKGQTLNKGKLSALEVALPPLPEQKKIAHILSTVQRAIEAQERIIQTTTELKKALMHQLFTEGLRHEPQKQTEIGPVPESWEVVKIKDHCIESAFGPRFGSELYAADGNILTLRTTDMEDDGRIDYNTAPLARIDYAKFEKHYLQVGDIVVSRSGTCGIASVFEGYSLPVLPGAFLIRLRMKESVQPMFLRHYINSPVGRPYVLQLAQGAIQKNISGTRLGDLLVPLPSRAEQEEISAAVGTIDQKLASHRQKLTANQDLFRTLLHELMTAKTRVANIDLANAT
jgi:type I restriction enzyme, S subunit